MQQHPLSSKPEHKAQLPRTGHPTSQSFGFTSSTGMILPVFYDFLRAGESVHYEGSLFSRSQPMVTAAMADVDVYVDWFFVPAQMLLLNIGSMMWMTNDLISSAVNPLSTMEGLLPVVDINGTMDMLMSYNAAGYGASWSDILGTSGEDSRFDCVGSSTFRLFNHLGLNPNGIFHKDASGSYNFQHDPNNPNIFPMFLLAYQAIYQDYFRVDSRERRDIRSFNLDSYEQYMGQPSAITEYEVFKLRYRPYHQDYFTGVNPTPIMDSVNMMGASAALIGPSPSDVLQKIDNYLGISSSGAFDTNPHLGNSQLNTYSQANSGDSPAFAGVNNSDSVNVRYGSNVGVITHAQYFNSNISTSNIRSMFAVEKLLRITGRARKDYDSQVLAHLGFEVPHDVKHELTHLGCDKAMLHIGEVVSTADTHVGATGAALGSISGKGYVNIRGKRRKFTAPCDGVFMAVYSAVPRVRYFGTYDKLNNFVDRLSFYQPEYDKLGAQPLYSFEAEAGVAGVSSTRIGWQYRYEQYKRKYDRVTEAFANNVYGGISGSVNQYSAWVLGRLPYKQNGSIVNLTFDDFLCPPTALDNIMVMPYVTSWSYDYIEKPWLMFARDPFINDFHCHCTKVSTMSRYGEPPLD